jgi:DHA1 family inner membrane transport protein
VRLPDGNPAPTEFLRGACSLYCMSVAAETISGRSRGGVAGVIAVIFVSLFTAQAAVIALSPSLARVAADLDVSTAAAGQLRTLCGLAAGVSALLATRIASRWALRTLMLRAAALVAVGSLLSSIGPTFELLALAQIVVGVGVGALVTGGTTAAAEWAPAEQRTRVLSWALTGQPAAWIVGMPLTGAIGELSWRYSLLALPLTASLFAMWRLAARPRVAPADRDVDLLESLREPDVGRWAAGELLGNAGWAGTLVYSGALIVQSYGIDGTTTGFVLAGAAVSFVGGNLTFRRFVADEPRPQLVRLSLLLALAVPLFGVVREGLAVSAALFGAAAFVAGGRMLIGNAFGLRAAPERRLTVMGVRAATTQFGYFLGAAAAGGALQLGGYAGLGIALGALFLASAVVQLELGRAREGCARVTT